tara:strand:+ start:9932 stop:10432 length:501 start_codon:yes stop_codon:yes gene_type:complete
MKIIKNALSEDLFSRCKKEVNKKLSENEWASSVIIWEPGLRQGISGSTIAAMTSEDIHNDIVKEISPHVPECEIVTQYYVWQPHSGIAMHDDSGRRFGATIYLNETWHPNSGGWFIWEDKDTREWNTILPTKNTMVLNTSKEKHLVTSVAPDGFAIRVTIQIWGLK